MTVWKRSSSGKNGTLLDICVRFLGCSWLFPSTHLKNMRMLVKWDHFARVRGENNTCLKSPPRKNGFHWGYSPKEVELWHFFGHLPKKARVLPLKGSYFEDLYCTPLLYWFMHISIGGFNDDS